MEIVAHTGQHHDRQALRTRPIEGRAQRHHIVGLAVDDQRIGRHRGHRKGRGGRADEHHALRRRVGRGQPRAQLRRDVAAEREAAQRQRQRRIARGRDHGQRVVDLADAVVPPPLRCTDTAKVEAHRTVAELHKGSCQGLDHLVVHRAAVLRVRVAQHRDAARGAIWRVDRRLDAAGWTGDVHGRARRGHQRPTVGGSSRRSTT